MIIINGKKHIISVMFSIIRTLDVHGPCLPLKKRQIKFVLEAYITGLYNLLLQSQSSEG